MGFHVRLSQDTSITIWNLRIADKTSLRIKAGEVEQEVSFAKFAALTDISYGAEGNDARAKMTTRDGAQSDVVLLLPPDTIVSGMTKLERHSCLSSSFARLPSPPQVTVGLPPL